MGYSLRNLSPDATAPKRRGRAAKATATFLGASALLAGMLSAPMASAAPADASQVPAVTASDIASSKYKAGTYIVTLKAAPAATYTGGISGYTRTKAPAGKQLDATMPAVTKYSALMSKRQSTLASQVGAKVIYNYTVAYNGFAAKLTAKQATRLARSSDVLTLTRAETLQLQESHSLEFLDVAGTAGTWDQIGGFANAGEGIVVGDVDSGIAPENPSFAGDPLGTTASPTEPYLDGDVVTFKKADGGTFTSTRSSATVQWSDNYYSTKLIGAESFVAGFGLSKIGSTTIGEYNSPRDGSGHGSHTASTAAGNHGVDASVEGQDFGTISGVAPAAKIAAYKACWSGPDGIEASPDDGCNTIDLLAAINQAVTDGVDVINYSIGGGSATTTYSPTDAAFLNASAAGIFVAASAGNDGPSESTLDNAAPWETTVAASTIPDYEGTVVLGNGAKYSGAGITVVGNFPTSGTAPLVLAEDHPAAGATAADANLCLPGSLGSVTGQIVVCDRGNNARAEKSEVVAAAGGIGMVLVNVPGGADDVDNDFHAVPTVHTFSANHDAIHAYAHAAGATAVLQEGNTTGSATPVPQIAGFSSHGPVLAAGSDVLKPDISAPGVSILAAYASAEGADPEFNFLSGTSMAAPHITGLAALYLGEHPLATPAEIKSVMMTGGTNLLDADGNDVTDPFTQGAGQVTPGTYLDAGFYYPADDEDWKSYVLGADQFADYGDFIPPIDFDGVDPIDPSDLNQASIAIGDFIGSQTVTRTVTSLAAGDYTATIDVEGIDAVVTPSTLHFDAAGETASFTVAFSNQSAPADAWATGFLTWAGSDQSLRSPVAIHPTTALVQAAGVGSGVVGNAEVTVTGGVDTNLPVALDSLMLGDVNDDSGEQDDLLSYLHEVVAGTASAEFNVDPVDAPAGVDLDLTVLYSPVRSNDIDDYVKVAASATASGSESTTIEDPAVGFYVAVVDFYSVPAGGTDIRESMYTDNPATNAVDVSVAPNPLALTIGDESTLTASWWGLAPNSDYRGYITYGETGLSTKLDVTTSAGVAPVNEELPSFTGSAAVGSTLTATVGEWDWDARHLQFGYQWTAGGAPISGANGSTFTVPASLLGQSIGLAVTAHLGESGDATATASTTATAVGSDGASGLTSLKAPTVSGSVQAGKVVTVSAGAYNVPDSAITLAYQWKAGGVPISGATSSTFTIPSSLVGASLTVTETASLTGSSLTASATSAAASVTANDGQGSLANVVKPTFSGEALLGKTVTATVGTWNLPSTDLTFTYQWTADGKAIPGATASTYKVGNAVLGDALAVTVTAHIGAIATSATSASEKVKAVATTTITIKDSTITTSQKAKVTVKVSANGSGKETGTVVLHYGSKKKTDELHSSDKGTLDFTLPKLKKGSYKVWAEYKGNSKVDGDNSIKKTLKVRKA